MQIIQCQEVLESLSTKGLTLCNLSCSLDPLGAGFTVLSIISLGGGPSLGNQPHTSVKTVVILTRTAITLIKT